jgi:DNA-binding transcriptional LysR family regulator
MAKSSDKLQKLRIFIAVVEQQSFVRAAQLLNLTPPTVSKAIQMLEAELNAQLLVRTTRSVAVTETGQRYFERALQILQDLEELDSEITDSHGVARGQLKITAPVAFGEHVLGPLMPEFLLQYPEVTVELDLTGDIRHLKRDGFDIGFRNGRIGQVQDFYYVPIRSLTPTLVASPKYLKKKGTPTHPNELAGHEFVLHRGGNRLFNRWTLISKSDEEFFFESKGRYVCNHIQNSITAAEMGLGILNTYAFYVEDAIREGKLIRLLPDYHQPDIERFAYYHQKRSLSAKVDAFLSFIETRIGSEA